MEGFFANSYDVILVVWGIVWMIGGTAFMYLMHRAIVAEGKSHGLTASPSTAVSLKHEATSEQKTLVSAGR